MNQFSKNFEFNSALQINGGLQENTSSIPLMHSNSRKYICQFKSQGYGLVISRKYDFMKKKDLKC